MKRWQRWNRWTRFIPHSYWMMASATLLLAFIGLNIVSLWQNGVVGEWAIFLFGLIAIVILSTFVVTIMNWRRDQL